MRFKCNAFDNEKGQQCNFFRWDHSEASWTPPNSSDGESYCSSLPSPSPPATTTSTAPLKEKCREIGCKQTRVRKNCNSRKCMAHCKAGGGCLATEHHVAGGIPCRDPIPSAPSLTVPTSTPPPVTQMPIASTSMSSTIIPGALPSHPLAPSSSTATSQLIAAAPSVPIPIAVPATINPLPNPKYSSQMAPIYIQEVERERLISQACMLQDEKQITAVQKLKQGVMVFAWTNVCVHSLKHYKLI